MSDHDRVTEVYRGDLFTRETQRILRDRIHWLCGQIVGERVLDIGCSQGIATLLAAREGHTVVGIDSEEPAIRFASDELAGEPEPVRARVTLIHSDIYAAQLEPHSFDTILLGEILEHQTKPGGLLARACELLSPAGRIVGSTPFGLHLHEDHKFTFYLSSFVDTVSPLTSIETLDIVDGYIRFILEPKKAEARPVPADPNVLLRLSETAFLEREWRAHETDLDRKKRIRALSDAQETLTKRVESVETEKRALQAEMTELEHLAQKRKTVLDRVTRELRDAHNARPGAQEETEALQPSSPPTPDERPSYSGIASRAAQALAGSWRREVRTGRLRTDPATSVKKTYSRIRRAVLDLPPPPPPGPGGATKQRKTATPKAAPSKIGRFQARTSRQPAPVVIATILDTFSQHCLQYEAKLVPLSIDGWEAELARSKPAFFLAESAWRGNQGQWKYLMTKYREREVNPLRDVLAYCRANRIPTVFWNKEDPSNFDVFKDVATEFDVIFTTDADCIARYRALAGHDRVYALPFAAQPAIHNPISDGIERNREVCFAGSWRADKYPERVAATQRLLEPAMAYQLDIFDRFHDTPGPKGLAFPAKYRKVVRGSLEYDQMLCAYRSYKAFLNVNSVTDSPTMFSRRVFELMACGTPVVSGPSKGMDRMFGRLVKPGASKAETRKSLEELLADDYYRERYAHAGYRDVLSNHTYSHRLDVVLRKLGLEPIGSEPPLVTILAATNRPDRLENLVSNVRRQTHPNVELIILLNSDAFDDAQVRRAARELHRVQVVRRPESDTLADCLNHGIDLSAGEFIAKFDDDDFYGPHYLSDALLAAGYTDAAVIGKHTYFCYLSASDRMALRFPKRQHRHVKFVHGATLVIRRSVLDSVRFTPVRQGTDTIFLRECRSHGFRVYSSDPFNFVHVRHADPTTHTWKISDDDFLRKCQVLQTGLDMTRVMI